MFACVFGERGSARDYLVSSKGNEVKIVVPDSFSLVHLFSRRRLLLEARLHWITRTDDFL